MGATIRDYAPGDEEAVVELSLRAWAPVFRSMEQILGPEIFVRLHGDWRAFQERAVRDALIDEAMHVWVAEAGGRVVAFAAATLYAERAMGEISMLAVDPADQDRGTGTALTEFVTAWLGEAGVRVAMIDTGGDPGHAPGPACVREGGLHADPDRPLLPGSLTRRRLIRHLLTRHLPKCRLLAWPLIPGQVSARACSSRRTSGA